MILVRDRHKDGKTVILKLQRKFYTENQKSIASTKLRHLINIFINLKYIRTHTWSLELCEKSSLEVTGRL